MDRERSRSRSSGGGSTSRYKTADRSGTQATITNWTTPGKKQGQEGSRAPGKALQTEGKEGGEDEDIEESVDSSSSSSKVEVVGTKPAASTGGTSDDEMSGEDNMSINDFEDANEEEPDGTKDKMEEEDTMEGALGLSATSDTPRGGAGGET